MAAGGDYISAVCHIFSQRLHTLKIPRVAVHGSNDDSEHDFQRKQGKESAEDQPRSIINCPYTEDHCDCSESLSFSFLKVKYIDLRSAAPIKRTNVH